MFWAIIEFNWACATRWFLIASFNREVVFGISFWIVKSVTLNPWIMLKRLEMALLIFDCLWKAVSTGWVDEIVGVDWRLEANE